MEADERQRQILARARNDGRVQVSTLADDLHVAPETVRRDLRQLVERGMLQRVHGGAHPVESAGYESNVDAPQPLADRGEATRSPPPRPPGSRARRRSTSTRASRRSSSPRRSREPAPGRQAHRGHLLAAGGRRSRRRPRNHRAAARWPGPRAARWPRSTTGPAGCSGELVIDLAFLGANGISREHGLTTPDPAVAAVKAQVVRQRPPPDLRRRAHQVRRLELLPLRRHPRLRGTGDRHRRQRRRRPPLQRARPPGGPGLSTRPTAQPANTSTASPVTTRHPNKRR